MALSNHERVGRVMDALQRGLFPFVIREYRSVYEDQAGHEIRDVATTNAFRLSPEAFKSVDALRESLDVHTLLHLMWRRWNEVFQDKLGHIGRSYVSELMTVRNTWAHQGSFTNDEAYRAADTAARLLDMISAGDQASEVKAQADELLRLRFEAAKKKQKRETEPLKPAEVTTSPGLKPWRDVVQPHPDVASGRYLQAQFAADLAQVLEGKAADEYQDPVEFFRRTYLTEGLLEMLTTGLRRLTAQGGDPVVQLQTAFGGGKSHSMLALYHLASGKLQLSDMLGGERLAEQLGDIDLPEANRAVLVGTALSPSEPRHKPDATVHTLWGELAYQLGGLEGYQMLQTADEKGVSPNSDTLTQLFNRFGPCLIMIDEFVAYARNIYGVEGLPSGSFDSVMTFMQALTEAVKRSSESILLVSLPESDIEVGGKAGQEALDRLAHVVGRLESVWKPVTPTESFEIVRRRLFNSDIDYTARDAVVDAFSEMYLNNKAEFPSGLSDSAYRERMRAAYPIHPELFDRLYEDWSTLDRFQRTRGVLRLMAAAIYNLWSKDDHSLMIMPGTLPLAEKTVRDEILRYLPDPWAAVVDHEIDGPHSQPLALDNQVTMLGRYAAARRVARTIFMGSAPTVTAQRVRGLEEVRIRLGCAQPGENLPVFGDALSRLRNQLSYLYSDDSRYWYDTRPTVNKLARDRAQAAKSADVLAEIEQRLRRVPKKGGFAGHHVAPANSSDVIDEDRARLVVLPPSATYRRTTETTEAEEMVHDILANRGSGQRLYRNMLIFVAPDQSGLEALETAVRDFMAWRSIHNDEETLNLDAQQRRQVATNLEQANETTDLRLLEAYSWLLTPVQTEAMGDLSLQANRINGHDNFYERAARKVKQDGLLIPLWSPANLRLELDQYIWNDERGWSVGLKQLWEYLARYCYLPRLLDHEVLVAAVRDGVAQISAPIAYASGVDAEGYHMGLVYQSNGQVYFDDNSLLIHPDHIARKPEPEVPPSPPIIDGGGSSDNGTSNGDSIDPPPVEKKARRYYGKVKLDPQRINKDVGQIVEEVIQHFTALVGSEVEVFLEIEARREDGFDESLVRTVTENGNTLKFDDQGFEVS